MCAHHAFSADGDDEDGVACLASGASMSAQQHRVPIHCCGAQLGEMIALCDKNAYSVGRDSHISRPGYFLPDHAERVLVLYKYLGDVSDLIETPPLFGLDRFGRIERIVLRRAAVLCWAQNAIRGMPMDCLMC